MKNDYRQRGLTDSETATYVGVSPSWLRQARSKGAPEGPPFVKIGHCVRYLIDDLDAWLESRKRTNTLGG